MKLSIFYLLFIPLFLQSCAGSKHYARLGEKQESAGLLTESADSYYMALRKKRDNIDAQIGMKRTGQLVLNTMLGEFSRLKNFGSARDAVNAFHAARDYRDKIQHVGVKLELADFYITDYEQVKATYLHALYEEGTSLLDQEKYAEAELKFQDIRKLDPTYKDAQELGDIAYLQPLYAEGINQMELSRFRAAYEAFEKVIAKKPTYKDTKKLRDECLEKGRYTVALLPFQNATSTSGLDARVSAYALEALTSIKDPFLRIVDREHVQIIIDEQKLQLSGVVDEATAVQVGELVGAQALLTGTVLGYSVQNGALRSQQRDAYEAYRVKRTNPADGKVYFDTKYRPVKYTEYYNSASVSISFQYKMISLKTGEIIKTEIIEKELKDEVLYGKYDGNPSDLFPGGPNGVNMSRQDRQAMISMFSGRQQLRSSSELTNDSFNAISTQLSTQIRNTMFSLVQ